jgi:hypothetical protein
MKRVAGLLLVLGILGFVGVFSPVPADAGCRYRCPSFYSVTDDLWGLAPNNDCDAAYNNAVAAVQNQAYERCTNGDVCRFGAVTIVTACMDKDPVMMPGVKRVDVNIQYTCGVEICIDPLPQQ